MMMLIDQSSHERFSVMNLTVTARFVVSFVAVVSVSLSLAPLASAQALELQSREAVSLDHPTGSSREEALSQELSQAFETLFTEVVYEQSPGVWKVNYDAAEREGVSVEDAQALAKLMESPLSDQSETTVTTYDLGTFAKCVVYNIAQFPISPDDAIAIGRLLKDKQWKAAADKIVATAALNGATSLLDYGISAVGGPVAWVAKLALYADHAH